MDLTTATPVEIDTDLARLWGERSQAAYESYSAVERLHYLVDDKQVGPWRNRSWTMTQDEVFAKAAEMVEADDYHRHDIERTVAKYEAAHAEAVRITGEIEVRNLEFNRRGGWTRAFLVNNTNGHVHRSMDCSTCFPTTQYFWVTEYSGGTEESVVEDAGERACTVCYPSAPVEVLSRPTKIFSDDERAAQKAREEKAAAKAARDAEKVTVEGIKEWDDRPRTKEFKTLRAASQFASSERTNVLTWRADHPDAERWAANAALVEAAIAEKTGRPVEEVSAEIAKKAAAAAKRRNR